MHNQIWIWNLAHAIQYVQVLISGLLPSFQSPFFWKHLHINGGVCWPLKPMRFFFSLFHGIYGAHVPVHICFCVVVVVVFFASSHRKKKKKPSEHPMTCMDHVKRKWQHRSLSRYPRPAFFSTGLRHLISPSLKIDSFKPPPFLPSLSPFPHPYSFPLLHPALVSTCQEQKQALRLHSKWETLVSKTFYVMENFCSDPDKGKKNSPRW